MCSALSKPRSPSQILMSGTFYSIPQLISQLFSSHISKPLYTRSRSSGALIRDELTHLQEEYDSSRFISNSLFGQMNDYPRNLHTSPISHPTPRPYTQCASAPLTPPFSQNLRALSTHSFPITSTLTPISRSKIPLTLSSRSLPPSSPPPVPLRPIIAALRVLGIRSISFSTTYPTSAASFSTQAHSAAYAEGGFGGFGAALRRLGLQYGSLHSWAGAPGAGLFGAWLAALGSGLGLLSAALSLWLVQSGLSVLPPEEPSAWSSLLSSESVEEGEGEEE